MVVCFFLAVHSRYCTTAANIITKAWAQAARVLRARPVPSPGDTGAPELDPWHPVHIQLVDVGLDARRAAQCQKLSGGGWSCPPPPTPPNPA
jgi:hypothetical protein